jgi:hypothetical protein
MRVLSTTEIETVSGGTFGCFNLLALLCWKPKAVCLPKPPVCSPPPVCEPKPACEPKPPCGETPPPVYN